MTAQTLNQKLDAIYAIKRKICDQLRYNGYSAEEAGNMLAKYPQLIQQLDVNSIVKYPQWFLDALVCWYDPSRQNLTNEQIKADTKANGFFLLKDFSPIPKGTDGKHLDMKMYNFAGEGVSGIGTYPLDFSKFIFFQDRANASYTGNTITIHSASVGKRIFIQQLPTIENGNLKCILKVNGLKDNEVLVFGHPEYSWNSVILKNGINKIDKTFANNNVNGFSFKEGFETVSNVTIEQLPLYDGALCFDGADDYGQSVNQPELTDYTVIANRVYIGENMKKQCFVDKGDGSAYPDKSAFVFEVVNNVCTSYGVNTLDLDIIHSPQITYQTKNSYNGKYIGSGDVLDSSYLTVGRNKNWANYFKGVLYSFLLFNKTLTPEQISWVKANIMNQYIDGEQNTSVGLLNEILG